MPERCTMTVLGNYSVPSDTNAKVYSVVVREDGRHTCDCIGFVTKRNKLGGLSALGQPECTCKHLKQVMATNKCGWTSETGKAQKYPSMCPECLSPVEHYDPPLPLQVDEEMLNDTMAGLIALRERMRS